MTGSALLENCLASRGKCESKCCYSSRSQNISDMSSACRVLPIFLRAMFSWSWITYVQIWLCRLYYSCSSKVIFTTTTTSNNPHHQQIQPQPSPPPPSLPPPPPPKKRGRKKVYQYVNVLFLLRNRHFPQNVKCRLPLCVY